MGLRDHVLACGDLTLEYGSCVILEDDLYVSPDAYRYSKKAVNAYADEPAVAGISLYGYRHDEYQRLSFQPLDDGYDTFFMQTPSSWGQAWTSGQWSDFRAWYRSVGDLGRIEMPRRAAGWSPVKSWKKYFLAYLIDTDRYFVFPHHSLTSNCGDPGTHFRQICHQFGDTDHNRPDGISASLRGADEAIRYDAWLNLIPDYRQVVAGIRRKRRDGGLPGLETSPSGSDEDAGLKSALPKSRGRLSHYSATPSD